METATARIAKESPPPKKGPKHAGDLSHIKHYKGTLSDEEVINMVLHVYSEGRSKRSIIRVAHLYGVECETLLGWVQGKTRRRCCIEAEKRYEKKHGHAPEYHIRNAEIGGSDE
jgi:hypothetical protein